MVRPSLHGSNTICHMHIPLRSIKLIWRVEIIPFFYLGEFCETVNNIHVWTCFLLEHNIRFKQLTVCLHLYANRPFEGISHMIELTECRSNLLGSLTPSTWSLMCAESFYDGHVFVDMHRQWADALAIERVHVARRCETNKQFITIFLKYWSVRFSISWKS